MEFPWRILVVDDDEAIAEQTAELLGIVELPPNGERPEVATETEFERAVARLEEERFDLLVLDVRDQSQTGEAEGPIEATGSEATDADVGLRVSDTVRRRRFVPIIFFTALPNLVGGDIPGSPFVSVISKNSHDSTVELQQQVKAVFESTLPAINRALLEHVDEIVREFMTDFVEEHWGALTPPPRKGDIAHLLLRRLALSLAEGGTVLAQRLLGEPLSLDSDRVHPMRYYLIPAVDECTTGDLVVGPPLIADTIGGTEVANPADADSGTGVKAETEREAEAPPETGTEAEPETEAEAWYVVITPSCDLVAAHLKADYVLLVECIALNGTDEYKSFISSRPQPGEDLSAQGKKADRELLQLMKNSSNLRQRDRTLYLPAAWEIPDLIIDFQRVSSLPLAKLSSGYRRVATIDSPFAEWIVEKFVRYVGRLGAPDLDVEIARNRLLLEGPAQ